MKKEKYKIFTDGATRGHNGKFGTVSHVGLGVYIENEKKGMSVTAEGFSNNEAEFMALILAMRYSIEHSIKNVDFFLDSMIVVNRANERNSKKSMGDGSRMARFQNEVRKLKKEFDNVSFTWIPREQNTEADKYSKTILIGGKIIPRNLFIKEEKHDKIF